MLFFLVFTIFTVKSGAISGLIFYASIVVANQNVFFPLGHKNYLGKYIMPWISLDFGIETCFYDGMDTYAKTWLQFVFPVYVLVLLLIITVLLKKKRYSALSKIIYRNNDRSSDEPGIPHPVYVTATFFILAYGKIVRTIIVSLSYTTLEYPNNKTETACVAVQWKYQIPSWQTYSPLCSVRDFVCSAHYTIHLISFIRSADPEDPYGYMDETTNKWNFKALS